MSADASPSSSGEAIRQTFDAVYERYRSVRGFVYAHISDRGAAQDITQQTYLLAWRALSQGCRPDRPVPWIFQIARNEIASFRRRTPARMTTHEVEHLVDRYDTPLERLCRSEAVARTRQELERIDRSTRRALTGVAEGGASYAELAEELGMCANTAKSRVHKARSYLRSRLGFFIEG